MDRFAHLVDSPAGVEGLEPCTTFPRGVSLQYCLLGEWLTHRREGEVVIPMIAFIKGGMRLPLGRVTKDFLIAYRICPH